MAPHRRAARHDRRARAGLVRTGAAGPDAPVPVDAEGEAVVSPIRTLGTAVRASRMLATIDGFPYDPLDPVLLIRTPQSRLTFDLRLPCTGPKLRSALAAAVVERLTVEQPEKVYTDYAAVRALAKATAQAVDGSVAMLGLDGFCTAMADISASAPSANALVYGLRRMEPFLGSAMDPLLRHELATIRPIKSKRRPGNARSPSDRNRTLSQAESDDLAASLAARLATGEVTAEDYALAALEATLVLRPAQIARLKARDLVPAGWVGGRQRFELRVARIKQRGKAAASSFRRRKLDPGLQALLVAQRDRAVRIVAADGIAAEDAPLFPRGPSTSVLGTAFPELEGYLRHSTSSDVSNSTEI